MIVNVVMADGQTTFQLATRKDLTRLLDRDNCGEEDRPIQGWIFRRWDAERGWLPVRMTYIRRNSIACVVSAEDLATDEADLPAKAEADRRRQQYEAAREAADAQEVTP